MLQSSLIIASEIPPFVTAPTVDGKVIKLNGQHETQDK
jgi:hypothetical protein